MISPFMPNAQTFVYCLIMIYNKRVGKPLVLVPVGYARVGLNLYQLYSQYQKNKETVAAVHQKKAKSACGVAKVLFCQDDWRGTKIMWTNHLGERRQGGNGTW